MKPKRIALLIILTLMISPVAVIAEDDVCYGNVYSYDDWDNPVYGSHVWSYDYTEEPTCTSEGYDVYSCDYCAETRYEYLPALGHNWSGPDLVESPSRYDTLIWGMECVNDDCGLTKYVPINVKKKKSKRLISKKELRQIKKLTNRKIKWTSSKKKVATVSNGVVKAKKKGTTYIKAKIWVKKYRINIYLKYKVVVK